MSVYWFNSDSVDLVPQISATAYHFKTTGSMLAFNLPPAEVGDIRIAAVASIRAYISSRPPTGWVTIQDNGSWSNNNLFVFGRAKQAGDSDAVSWATAGYDSEFIVFVAVLPKVIPIPNASAKSEGTGLTWPTPAVTTTMPNCLILRYAVSSGTGVADIAWGNDVESTFSYTIADKLTLGVAMQKARDPGVYAAVNAGQPASRRFSTTTVAAAPSG